MYMCKAYVSKTGEIIHVAKYITYSMDIPQTII